ncbi:hypothetical protein GPALN_005472 [Globodera pallida]|nr:hypothetical protein GPALN_005472 [Globodera pallida]
MKQMSLDWSIPFKGGGLSCPLLKKCSKVFPAKTAVWRGQFSANTKNTTYFGAAKLSIIGRAKRVFLIRENFNEKLLGFTQKAGMLFFYLKTFASEKIIRNITCLIL